MQKKKPLLLLLKLLLLKPLLLLLKPLLLLLKPLLLLLKKRSKNFSVVQKSRRKPAFCFSVSGDLGNRER